MYGLNYLVYRKSPAGGGELMAAFATGADARAYLKEQQRIYTELHETLRAETPPDAFYIKTDE